MWAQTPIKIDPNLNSRTNNQSVKSQKYVIENPFFTKSLLVIDVQLCIRHCYLFFKYSITILFTFIVVPKKSVRHLGLI